MIKIGSGDAHLSVMVLFRAPLVFLELLASPDQEEDLDPRALRVQLDREASL